MTHRGPFQPLTFCVILCVKCLLMLLLLFPGTLKVVLLQCRNTSTLWGNRLVTPESRNLCAITTDQLTCQYLDS